MKSAPLLHLFPVESNAIFDGEDPVENHVFQLVENFLDSSAVGGAPPFEFSYFTISLQTNGNLYYCWNQGTACYAGGDLAPSTSSHTALPDGALGGKRVHHGNMQLPEWIIPPVPGHNHTLNSTEAEFFLPWKTLSGTISSLFPPNPLHGVAMGPEFTVDYRIGESGCSWWSLRNQYLPCGTIVYRSTQDANRVSNAGTRTCNPQMCIPQTVGPKPTGRCYGIFDLTARDDREDGDINFHMLSEQTDGSVYWTNLLGVLVSDAGFLWEDSLPVVA